MRTTSSPTEVVVQIQAPHFTCGIVVDQDRVTVAADIVKYMVGWSADQVREYVKKKSWKAILASSKTSKRT